MPLPATSNADVVIIGDGLIGLSTALALARRGAGVALIGARHGGTASEAAAGLLSPHVGTLPENVRRFYLASLARYPSFLEPLREYDPGLSKVEGLVEVLPATGRVPASTGRVRPAANGPTDDLPADAARDLEPALSAPHGAIFHAEDGAVDNVRLVRALRQAAAHSLRISVVENDPVTHIRPTHAAVVIVTQSGRRVEGKKAVVAAGAWAPAIQGLPRPLPVRPLKGQMLAFGATPLRHPAMSDDIYLVPRETETVAGATVEEAGFDTNTSDEAIESLRRAAVTLCPSLDSAPVIRRWAGIRPATPDLLPIVGPDPDAPNLLYACGHSRNGILLAPSTADAIAALAQDRKSDVDLAGLTITRFTTG
jgi:glycine oxidase ThiO